MSSQIDNHELFDVDDIDRDRDTDFSTFGHGRYIQGNFP